MGLVILDRLIFILTCIKIAFVINPCAFAQGFITEIFFNLEDYAKRQLF